MKKFKQLKQALEIGTKEIVNTYKKATPGEMTDARNKDLEENFSWNDVNSALTKANYMRGKPSEIEKVASKFKYKSGKDKNFSLADIKKNLSAAGIDGAKQHDVMKHMKEEVELDEAMTSAIEIDDFFSMDSDQREKLVKLAKKYNLKTPIEKRGRKNVAVVDGNKKTMQSFEKELKSLGIKFTATESTELEEKAPLKMQNMRDLKKMVSSMVMDVDDKTLMKVARAMGKSLYFDKLGKPILEASEDDEPASPDEASMAIKQAEFIQYVGREVKEYVEDANKFPEWMQNKLSELHQKAKDLHATLGDHGDDEMDEATVNTADIQKKKNISKSDTDKLLKLRQMLDKEKKK